ncbi:MAG: metallophosphoesterase, partial [Aureibaculum sp.]
GMYSGKYNYKVLKYSLEFDDLPDAYDGYQITQISDIHSGSFDDPNKINYGVDLINEQNSDLLLFTGDLVNNRADEMIPWVDTFKKLTAKDGKFSVLGNHDYGDYVDWESEEAKTDNMEKIKDIHKQLGFDLLLNDHRILKKGDEKIALIGVENWGAGRFKKVGDLNKASASVNELDFKILMSHDPSHWEQEVKDHKTHYHLTLSGHTHGMQFGIEIPGWIKWSPVKWRYKYWAGIYEQAGQILNVNRGFGYLAYPGRVGIWPEISVITLKKRLIS